jgi:hypothetical protein
MDVLLPLKITVKTKEKPLFIKISFYQTFPSSLLIEEETEKI